MPATDSPSKQVRWIGSSKDDLRSFPEEVRRRVGGALWEAQIGRKAPYAKPLKGFGGAGVLEIVDDFRRQRVSDRVRRAACQGRLRAARLPEEIQARRRYGKVRPRSHRSEASASE